MVLLKILPNVTGSGSTGLKRKFLFSHFLENNFRIFAKIAGENIRELYSRKLGRKFRGTLQTGKKIDHPLWQKRKAATEKLMGLSEQYF
jgi:hypothetical protein